MCVFVIEFFISKIHEVCMNLWQRQPIFDIQIWKTCSWIYPRSTYVHIGRQESWPLDQLTYSVHVCFNGVLFKVKRRVEYSNGKTFSSLSVANPCHVQLAALAAVETDMPLLGQFTPTCTSEGKYEMVQCHRSTGYCWCADTETGVKKQGTDVRGTPDCTGI